MCRIRIPACTSMALCYDHIIRGDSSHQKGNNDPSSMELYMKLMLELIEEGAPQSVTVHYVK